MKKCRSAIALLIMVIMIFTMMPLQAYAGNHFQTLEPYTIPLYDSNNKLSKINVMDLLPEGAQEGEYAMSFEEIWIPYWGYDYDYMDCTVLYGGHLPDITKNSRYNRFTDFTANGAGTLNIIIQKKITWGKQTTWTEYAQCQITVTVDKTPLQMMVNDTVTLRELLKAAKGHTLGDGNRVVIQSTDTGTVAPPTHWVSGLSDNEWYCDSNGLNQVITAKKVSDEKVLVTIYKYSFALDNYFDYGYTDYYSDIAEFEISVYEPPTTVDLTFDANNGVFDGGDKKKYYNADIKQEFNFNDNEVPEPARDGYLFAGWATSTAIDAPTVAAITASQSTTLYAQWNGELSISAEGDEVFYDALPHKIRVTNDENATLLYRIGESGEWMTINPAITTPGAMTVYVKATKDKYQEKTVNATVVIKKAPLYITPESITWTYSDKLPEFTFTSNGAVNGESVVFADAAMKTDFFNTPGDHSIFFEGTPTLTGSKEDGYAQSSNYEIITGRGILSVERANLTITAGSIQFAYNGSQQDYPTYTAVGLVTGDAISSIDITGSAMYGNSSSPNVVSDAVIKRLLPGQNEMDVTECYDITYGQGTISIAASESDNASRSHKKRTPVEDATNIVDEKIPLGELPALNITEHFNYMKGYPDGTFKPEDCITREEVAEIFYRLLVDETRALYEATDETFADIEDGRWSQLAIATLAKAKVIDGYKDGNFYPTKAITRAEFAAICASFDSLEASDKDMFKDISNHWAREQINSANIKGWIGGYPDGTFQPDQNITRAETAAMINNVLNRKVDVEGLLDTAKKFKDTTVDSWYYCDVLEATNNHEYEQRANILDPEKWTKVMVDKTWK